MQPNRNKQKKLSKVNGSSLLPLLADQRTAETRMLLKKYNRPDAKDADDLALKLAELYRDSSDKLTLEKEFAELHPHKSFILRTLATKPEVKTPETPAEANQKNKEFILAEGNYSNCSGGKCSCQPKFSNACGCGQSNFEGKSSNYPAPRRTVDQGQMIQNTIMVIGVIGIFVLATAIVVTNSKNRQA